MIPFLVCLAPTLFIFMVCIACTAADKKQEEPRWKNVIVPGIILYACIAIFAYGISLI